MASGNVPGATFFWGRFRLTVPLRPQKRRSYAERDNCVGDVGGATPSPARCTESRVESRVPPSCRRGGPSADSLHGPGPHRPSAPGPSKQAPQPRLIGGKVRGHNTKEARNEGSPDHQPDPAGVASAGLARPRGLRTRDPGDRGRGAAVHERRGGPRLEPLRSERARQPTHCARHARHRPGAAGFRASRGDGAGRRLRRRQRDRRRASAVSRRASAGLAVRL